MVVRSPCQENDPADAHPSAHKSVLESANPRMNSECASGCTCSTARARAPSPGQPTPGVVKQDKSSGDSVDTTKTRSGPQRVRMSSGERPISAAKGKQSDTEALCLPPHPPASVVCIVLLEWDYVAGPWRSERSVDPLRAVRRRACVSAPTARRRTVAFSRERGAAPPERGDLRVQSVTALGHPRSSDVCVSRCCCPWPCDVEVSSPGAWDGVQHTATAGVLFRRVSQWGTSCVRTPPPSLKKLRPCPSHSGCRDRITLGPHLIRYQMQCSHIRQGFGDEFADYIGSGTHLL